MTVDSRRKGATYELAVVKWLNAHSWPFAERRIMGMAADKGDVTGMGPVVIECKNRKDFDLAGYVTQLEEEIHTAGAETGVVIVKRRGVIDVGRHYAVMPVNLWADLMVEAGRA